MIDYAQRQSSALSIEIIDDLRVGGKQWPKNLS